MGRPKALLPLYQGSDESFVQRLCRITSELGHQLAVVSSLPVQELGVDIPFVHQAHPEQGQLSSLLLGWETFGSNCDWVMSCLVDHPYVSQETVEHLVEATSRFPDAQMWSPSYKMRGGHPAIFSAQLMERLKSADLSLGARPIVQSLGEQRCWVEVDDETVRWDVDTPENYLDYSGRWEKD